MSFQPGVYNFIHKKGQFIVAFRPSGVFDCPKFPEQATWSVFPTEQKLVIDWKKYGKYEFALTSTAATTYDGHAEGEPSNWRKMEFLRDFNATENLLFGDYGYGTVWNFIYEKGSFEIEFCCDGFNHFICPQYPAHSHWEIDETGLIAINWGQYAENGTELTGHKKGQPSNWRRATRLRSLTSESLTTLPAHDHHHAHVHDGNCNH